MDANDQSKLNAVINGFTAQARDCDKIALAAEQAAQRHREGAAALLRSAEAAERQAQEYRQLATTSRQNVEMLKRKGGA